MSRPDTFYSSTKNDILLDNSGNLRLDKDPKEVWADIHPEHYPVRVNRADREALLKVPGLGPDTVKRILKMRQEQRITSIADLGIKGKRLEKASPYVIFE